ncbi:MAG: hypothetical protein AAF492_03230 [Verrucomicrobiota bacterium]
MSIATFNVDATPPIGTALAYDMVKAEGQPLSARGVVLMGDFKPIVLCAVDWIGIGNNSQTAWKSILAQAAGTLPSRVAVHTLHQHDAPFDDQSIVDLARVYGLQGNFADAGFVSKTMARAARAIRDGIRAPSPITHVGMGQGKVEKVASNRRIQGPDGKVKQMRWTACRDPALRALPEGVIDPLARVIGFWNGDQPVAVLSYYATHPQSFYRTGAPHPDFPGMARSLREKAVPGALHVHFTGAAGDIGAGKYNDGSPENRPILARRLAAGLERAWQDALRSRKVLRPGQVGWRMEPVTLPPSQGYAEESLVRAIESGPAGSRVEQGRALVWWRRCQSGPPIELGCLRLDDALVLHMPGELLVEYQLAAQTMRPERFVCMAAYGDYGPGYIGTREAYPQGGYETGPASRVAPDVEDVLMNAMRKLLLPAEKE